MRCGGDVRGDDDGGANVVVGEAPAALTRTLITPPRKPYNGAGA
jgi:hypothetical protein